MRKRTSTSKTPDTQPAAMHEPDADVSSEGRLSRRHFLTSSAAGVLPVPSHPRRWLARL